MRFQRGDHISVDIYFEQSLLFGSIPPSGFQLKYTFPKLLRLYFRKTHEQRGTRPNLLQIEFFWDNMHVVRRTIRSEYFSVGVANHTSGRGQSTLAYNVASSLRIVKFTIKYLQNKEPANENGENRKDKEHEPTVFSPKI